MTNPALSVPRRAKAAAAFLAAGLVLAAVAPAAAVGMPPKPAPVVTAERIPAPRAEVMALAEQPLEQAIAYCESRFRSYDRVTGTYLGYDGQEHACP